MQIRLTDQNEKLLAEYRTEAKKVLPLYNEADSTIVNGMLTDKLREEIERMKGRKK